MHTKACGAWKLPELLPRRLHWMVDDIYIDHNEKTLKLGQLQLAHHQKNLFLIHLYTSPSWGFFLNMNAND